MDKSYTPNGAKNGAHMQTYFHDTMFEFLGIYDYDEMMCLKMALYYGNDSNNDWTVFK